MITTEYMALDTWMTIAARHRWYWVRECFDMDEPYMVRESHQAPPGYEPVVAPDYWDARTPDCDVSPEFWDFYSRHLYEPEDAAERAISAMLHRVGMVNAIQETSADLATARHARKCAEAASYARVGAAAARSEAAARLEAKREAKRKRESTRMWEATRKRVTASHMRNETMPIPEGSPGRDIYLAYALECQLRPGRSPEAWMACERAAVLEAANKWAREVGSFAITPVHVEDAEVRAADHADYAARWATILHDYMRSRDSWRSPWRP